MTKYSELIRVLQRNGWYKVRQKGSHIIMAHKYKLGKLTVPFHSGKEVPSGIFTSIMKQADVKLKKR